MAKVTENDIDVMIEELEEAGIDDDGVCVRYRPYECEVPILVEALKAYKASLAENKMAEVAKLFGKKLGEEFKVKIYQKREEYLCRFTCDDLEVAGWDKIFTKTGTWLLYIMIKGEAVVVDE